MTAPVTCARTGKQGADMAEVEPGALHASAYRSTGLLRKKASPSTESTGTTRRQAIRVSVKLNKGSDKHQDAR
jgi:hypothetical protein